MNKAVVLAVYNRKGGIGKTAAVVNLGAQFAMNGYKVLLIDGDPQINLTQYFYRGDENFFDDSAKIRENISTLYDVMVGEADIRGSVMTLDLTSIRQKSSRKKEQPELHCSFDILPGSPDMVYVDVDDESLGVLENAMSYISDEYDYVIIDFPPSYNGTAMDYLYASDYVIVPLKIGEDESIDGYVDLVNRIIESHKAGGHAVLLGLFFTFVHNNWKSHADQCDYSLSPEMQDQMPFFKSHIREINSIVQNAKYERLPLCLYADKEGITKDYRDLAAEIDEKIKKIEKEET